MSKAEDKLIDKTKFRIWLRIALGMNSLKVQPSDVKKELRKLVRLAREEERQEMLAKGWVSNGRGSISNLVIKTRLDTAKEIFEWLENETHKPTRVYLNHLKIRIPVYNERIELIKTRLNVSVNEAKNRFLSKPPSDNRGKT